jgi:phage replication-related protein YjqB (UPF0714/DUF867 family)
MADTYANFRMLQRSEREDRDFRVTIFRRNAATVVLAPHGGGIEPGTSEIAKAIVGNELSFYAFEGIKPSGNGRLHITSTRFDEPRCVALLADAERAIAIHGEETKGEVAFLGGCDDHIGGRLRLALTNSGFRVRRHASSALQGRNNFNI